MAEATAEKPRIPRRKVLTAAFATGAAVGAGAAFAAVNFIREEGRKIVREQAQAAERQEALKRAELSLEKFVGREGWVVVSRDNRPFIVPKGVNIRRAISAFSEDVEKAKRHPEYRLINPFILIALEDSSDRGPNNTPLDSQKRVLGEETWDKNARPFTGQAWVLIPGIGFANIWAIMEESDWMRRQILGNGFQFIRGTLKRSDSGGFELQTESGETTRVGMASP